MLHNLFATPIFVRDFEGEELDAIQAQITKALPRIEASLKNPPWGDNIGSTWVQGHNKTIEDYLLEGLAMGIINAGIDFLGEMQYEGPSLRFDESWVNVTSRGGFMFDHVHPRSRVSGVYYYATNGEDGSLRFSNPYPHQQMGMWPYDGMIMPELHIEPKVGRLILFPSSLTHRVEPNCTDNKRISVNFTLI